MNGLPDIETLLTNGRLAVTLVSLNGDILYESPMACELLSRADAEGRSLIASLSVPSGWEDLLEKVTAGRDIVDEPVLIDTHHADAELCYLTVFPQRDAHTRLQSLLCVWAARKGALRHPSIADTDADAGNYTRELEELLEHRTYQHLLSAEQNEFAGQVLDILPVGILVLSIDGDIVYRNRAMADDFGLRPADYLQPNIRYILTADLHEAFMHVVDTGLRSFHAGKDPAGIVAAVDILPLLKAGTVQRIVFTFSRLVSSNEAGV